MAAAEQQHAAIRRDCRAAGKTALHIERPEEVRPEWSDGAAVVGLTAGTSTLRETVEAVLRRLEELPGRIHDQTTQTLLQGEVSAWHPCREGI